MENLPGTSVQAANLSFDRSSISSASPDKGGRPPVLHLSPKSKQKRRWQQKQDSRKKIKADQRAKLDLISELEKTIFDNLLKHQKEKDALVSEISELKDTLSVTEEMLKEATTRAEEADSKYADYVKNTNRKIKAAVNEAIDREREKSKKELEKLTTNIGELKKKVGEQRQILHLSDRAREELAEKKPNCCRRWKIFLGSCPHR